MKPKIAVAAAIFGDSSTVITNYTHAVESFGGLPFVICNAEKDDMPAILGIADALLLMGGGDVNAARFGRENHPLSSLVPPERDETEFLLAQAFHAAKKPILAICRGCQVLNCAMGGDLHQHIPDVYGDTVTHSNKETRHIIEITQSSLLAGIFEQKSQITVNSTHHQAVNRTAPGFETGARSPDGVIEAISCGLSLGVQFHPERIINEGMEPLWRWFISCAAGQS